VKTRTTTTAPTQPRERIATAVEYGAGIAVWTTQGAAAAAYIAAAGRPSMWQTTLSKNPVSAICMCVFVIGAVAMWVISMCGEQAWFYDRLQQRSFRRLGVACHLGVVLIAALIVSESTDRAAWWATIGIFCFAATATWMSWMEVKFLPEEDQAVIDAIIRREAAQRAAAFDASERERRRARLTAIVENLGYTLTDAPTQADKPAEPAAVRWTIPAGKHAPLVYFIRNGNRMKIGTTTELKRRIRTLALRAENVALLVDGDQRREREFHKQFADLRVGRTEWFAYEGALADYVRDEVNRVSKKGRSQ
jgi:hypothetical protein